MSRPGGKAEWNPKQRFSSLEIEWDEAPPDAHLEVIEDQSKGILARNDSPDIPFDWSVNPYRGCTHACAYCYARAFHEFLGWGAGTDFERRILVKKDAPRLLEQAFEKPSWKGESLSISGVTDPYQPLERRYEITRGILEVCARYRNPVGVITRSPLITRDLDHLVELARHDAVRVHVSIPILDPVLCRLIEPGAPAPERRLEAVKALAQAGIPVGVSVSPIIPGLNDSAIPRTLQAARAAGARWAWRIPVRLSPSVEAVFEKRLREVLPLKAEAVMSKIRRMRGEGPLWGGRPDRPGGRMRGEGEHWQATQALFDLWHKKLGFEGPEPRPPQSPFRRPPRAGGGGGQLPLFRPS